MDARCGSVRPQNSLVLRERRQMEKIARKSRDALQTSDGSSVAQKPKAELSASDAAAEAAYSVIAEGGDEAAAEAAATKALTEARASDAAAGDAPASDALKPEEPSLTRTISASLTRTISASQQSARAPRSPPVLAAAQPRVRPACVCPASPLVRSPRSRRACARAPSSSSCLLAEATRLVKQLTAAVTDVAAPAPPPAEGTPRAAAAEQAKD